MSTGTCFDVFLFPRSAWRRRVRTRMLLQRRGLDPALRSALHARRYLKRFLKRDGSEKDVLQRAFGVDILNTHDLGASGFRQEGRLYSSPGHFMDTPYHLALTYTVDSGKQHAIALIGFRPGVVIADTVYVNQIQAMLLADLGRSWAPEWQRAAQAAETLLSNVRWEQMLITLLEDWARVSGFRRVGILQAKYSMWYRQCTKRDERLYLRHDVTARRMKYKQPNGTNGRYWIKALPPV